MSEAPKLSERDQALYDVSMMLRKYRDTKPKPRKESEGLSPAKRAHWAYMQGTETGERTALYSAILRVEALMTDRSPVEKNPP